MAACLPTLLFIYLWLPWGSATWGPLGQCFLTAFLQNGGTSGPDFRLYVSSPQEVRTSEQRPALVTVEAPGAAFRQNLNLEPGRTRCVQLPSSVELRGSGVGLGAVQVTSSLPLSVMAVNARASSLDTALIFPCDQLGRRYTVVTPALQSRDRYKEFAVVVGSQGTRVQLTPPCAVTLGGVTHQAGQPLDVNLAPYEAVQVQSEADLSGTSVNAEHPVAVVAGHSCLRSGRDCEHVCEQLLPTGHWGRVYAVPPFATRDPGTKNDYVYVVSDSGGQLNFWSGGTAGEKVLNPGHVLRFPVDSLRPLVLRSSASVQVLFLAGGGSRQGMTYDPWFALVPSVGSYGHCYSLTEHPGFSNLALLVAPGEGPEPGTVLLDKQPLTDLRWQRIPCGDGSFSWAEVAYGTGGGGSHSLETLGGQEIGVLSCGTSASAGFGTQAVRHTVIQSGTEFRCLQDLRSLGQAPESSLLQTEPRPRPQLLLLPHSQPGTLPEAGSPTLPLPNPFPHSLSSPPGLPPHPFPLDPGSVYPRTCKNYFCTEGTSCHLVKNHPQCVAQQPPVAVAVAEAAGKPVTIIEPESLSGAKAEVPSGTVIKPASIPEPAVVAGLVSGSVSGPVAKTLGGSIPGPIVVARPVGESVSEHQPGQLGATLTGQGIGFIAGSVAQSAIESTGASVSESGLGNLGVPVGESGLGSIGAPMGESEVGSLGAPVGESDLESLGAPVGESGLGSIGVPVGESGLGSIGAPVGESEVGSIGAPVGESDLESLGPPAGESGLGSIGAPVGESGLGSIGAPVGESGLESLGAPVGESGVGSMEVPVGESGLGSLGAPVGESELGSLGAPVGESGLGSIGAPVGQSELGSLGALVGESGLGSEGASTAESGLESLGVAGEEPGLVTRLETTGETVTEATPGTEPTTAGTCWASGLPHFHTFDGRSFAVPGACAYTVCRCTKDVPEAGLPAFHVWFGGAGGRLPLRHVALSVFGLTITAVKYEYGYVRVEQQRVRLPVTLAGGRLRLRYRGTELWAEVQAEAMSGIRIGTGIGAKEGAGAEEEAGARTRTRAKAGVPVKAGAGTGASTKADEGSDTWIGTETGAKAGAGAVAWIGTSTGTRAKAEAAVGSKTGTGAQARARVASRTWTVAETSTGNKANVRITTGAELGSQVAFRLIYDWQQALCLKVSGGYRSRVGGLCGNFNGDPADDLSLMMQGTVLVSDPRIPGTVLSSSASTRAFAQAWALEPSSAPCHSKWGSSCILGPEGPGMKTCMLMESQVGPFRNCHQILDPKPFVLSCLEAACAFPGYRPVICRELETYAHACQREGVSLGLWRLLTSCPLICGANSHYEACGSACPVTCADQHRRSPQPCPLPCLETCACDPGFVRSGPACVARKGPGCGCLLDGLLLGPGEGIWMGPGCGHRCWCPASGGKVRCERTSCGPNERCTVIDGVRGCRATRITTCRAAGAGHFETFDGQRYRFSGSCSYLLSGLRSYRFGEKRYLIPFRVLLNAGPAGIPRGVEVYVPGCHVRLDQGQPGRVLVNGAWRNLPCQVGRRVLIFRRGWDTVVSCPFGLEVAFDGGSHLVLALPRSYSGQVNGLCANYDGDPTNDLSPASGHPPVSDLAGAMALIRSCRIGPTEGCREEVDAKWKGITGRCKGAINGCHILIAPEGPFRLCHQQLFPRGYFEDCIRDACLIPRRGACPIIEDYVAACQEEGILIYPWRTSNFCYPPCPAHSHYELCGPACPITCGSLSGPVGCQAGRCREGCVCDPGFVLSGATCVPLRQCGCLLSGLYYEPGIQLPGIWGVPCRGPCICQPGGQVFCPCKTSQVTLDPGFSDLGLCSVSGGPHCRTFDGTTFHLRGHCSYILAGTTPNCPAGLPPFSVKVEGAAANHITLTAAGHHFVLDRGDWGYVMVDGVRRYLPFGLPGGGVRAFMQGASMVLVVQGGPRLLLSQGPHLSLTLPASYRGCTMGLCGNFNGNSADDLRSLALDRGLQSCPSPQPCPSPSCPIVEEAASAPFRGPKSCGLLLSARGPFAPCHRTLPPDPFFQSCLANAIHSRGNHNILCHCLRSYVAACQEAGARVLPWRNSKLCPMHCPKHSRYSLCADPCPAACPDVRAIVRHPARCAEGCQCDPGFFPAAGACVPLKNCPCFHRGLYFSPRRTVLTNHCTSACSCQPGKGVTCVPHQCPGGYFCRISSGVLDCLGPAYPLVTPPLVPGIGPSCPLHSRYVPCGPACPATCANPAAPAHCSQPCTPSCQCVPGRLLLAGRCVPSEQCGCLLRPGKAFWTEGCARRCRCPTVGDSGNTGIQCWPAQCQGQCEEASGGGHHCQLIRLGSGPQNVTCTTSGDFHFQTFSGTRYTFPGSCVYRLAGPCSKGGSGGIGPFYLDMAPHIRPLGSSKSLSLRACGLKLSMSPVDPNLLQVNGILEALPFFHGHCLQAYSCGGQLCLDTASGLSLTYDWDSLVRLSVPRALARSLCGLCGVTVEGIPMSQLSYLAHSWKVAEIPGCGPSCEPHCPPPCPPSQHGHYQGLDYCGLLSAPAGPLATCHPILDPQPFMENCLDEVCRHRGCRRALCRALTTYVTACQAGGGHPGPWRTPTLCPLQCPANSHYKLCGPRCPMTCGNLKGPKACQAEGLCQEGCVCNAGFVLSGATCVPRGRCGCLHAGRYHGLETAWYPGPGCKKRCHCGPGGTVSCGPGPCSSHEACTIRRGIRGCFPDGRARCFLVGPTHGLTFDGRVLEGLAAQCASLLARTTGSVPEPFDLQVEKDVAGPRRIRLRIYGHQLVLDRRAPGIIMVDGERYWLPLVLPGGRLWVTREGRMVTVQAACGLRLLYDSARHLQLTLPSTYQGHLSGLCGNFNGDNGIDDFGPSGSLETFAASWNLPGSGPCSPPGPCPPCPRGLDSAFSGPSACGLLRLPKGPFGSCHSFVRPDPFYGFCLRDTCQGQGQGSRQGLCDSLTAYTEACQEAGALVQPWRGPKLCPLRCPQRSHYSICARTCDLGCVPLLGPSRCSPHCFEGCECDPGFVYNGAGCVPQEQCGCFHLGRYIPVGKSRVLPGCRERCICQAGGRLNCRPFQCPQASGCNLDRGVRLCRGPLGKGSATCRLVPGGLFITFDGFKGKVPALAAPGTYELSVLAGDNSQDPAWFHVATEYAPCSACPAPQAWVIIHFRDCCVAVGPNREVWVNGHRAQLPAQVCEGVTARWAGSGKVLVERPPLLRVQVGPKGTVILRVARALGGQLQAACGDFNGDARDDLRLRGGLPATSLDDVFQSCRAQAFSACMKKVYSPVYNKDYFST